MSLPVYHYFHDSEKVYACGVKPNKKNKAVEPPNGRMFYPSTTSRPCRSCIKAIEADERDGRWSRRGKRKAKVS